MFEEGHTGVIDDPYLADDPKANRVTTRNELSECVQFEPIFDYFREKNKGFYEQAWRRPNKTRQK